MLIPIIKWRLKSGKQKVIQNSFLGCQRFCDSVVTEDNWKMKRHFPFSLFLFSAIFGICVTNGAEDVCKLAKDVGRCRAAKPMFYFNMETKRCEGFLYKGCGGNANKFENLEECHEACQHHLVCDNDKPLYRNVDFGFLCFCKILMLWKLMLIVFMIW